MAAGRVRVLIWHRPGDRADELAGEYHRISRALAGTPGLLGNQLWESGDGRIVMSEWADLDAFQRWARDPDQHRVTASLRGYRTPDDPPAALYRVVRTGHASPTDPTDPTDHADPTDTTATEDRDAVRSDHL